MSDEAVSVVVRFSLTEPIANVNVGFALVDISGNVVFETYCQDRVSILPQSLKSNCNYCLVCCIPAGLLNEGVYAIYPRAAIHRKGWLCIAERGPQFQISFDVPNQDLVVSRRSGAVAPLCEWKLDGRERSLGPVQCHLDDRNQVER